MSFFSRSRNNNKSNATTATPPPVPQEPTPVVKPKPPLDAPIYEADVLQDPPPAYYVVKDKVQQELLKEYKPGTDNQNTEEGKRKIEPIFNLAMAESGLVLSRVDKDKFLDAIVAEILGFGPIQPLLDEDSISEVMVNGPYQIYVEKGGKLRLTNVKFRDNDHVLSIIERIIAPLGRRIDESSPMVDARLPDGSRVNAIIPPLAIDGPSITIRKFSKIPLTVNDLIRFGSITQEAAKFVEAAVISRLNIIVSGGTGSGKTTQLNVLSSFIPSDERIVTIEDSAELQMHQDHVVRLETRPPNIEGKGAITIRDLVINSLRMRPERLVVGECRGGEALDMLQAMNTGHDGSMSTAHSNSPRDTLARMETMVLMAGMDLPLRAIRQQIAAAVDMIVHVERMRDGSRKVVKISEVLGMEGETILMQDIFEFVEEDFVDGKVVGALQPTGIRPRVMDRFKSDQIDLPKNLFSPSLSGLF
jgi:pilus assembly protein CpaF